MGREVITSINFCQLRNVVYPKQYSFYSTDVDFQRFPLTVLEIPGKFLNWYKYIPGPGNSLKISARCS